MSIAGLVLSNLHDSTIPELTAQRTTGALPFGGRYRMVDFALSAMVNAGVRNIKVVAHHNYQSLMEHIGSGKDFDLARHRGGVRVVPPYSRAFDHSAECYDSRMKTLISVRGLIDDTEEDDVLCCDCDIVMAPNFSALVKEHEQTGAAMTVAAFGGEMQNIWIAKTSFLRGVLKEAEERGFTSFHRDVLKEGLREGTVSIFPLTGELLPVRTLTAYYAAHMRLVHEEKLRHEILENPRAPLMTKVMCSPPVRYGKHATVESSLIADGCVIEGTVRNSVIFRGVRVGEGCTVENAVLMENCVLHGTAAVNAAILEKRVTLEGVVELKGHPTLPFFVESDKTIC